MNTIRIVLGKLHRSEINNDEAEALLTKLPNAQLASFIVDAKNRGWISNFNLGLDDEGNQV